MEPTVFHSRNGFTLVEVLVSLLILAIGLLASLVGVMAAVNYNLSNDMRSEAIKIAQEQQESIRNMPFASIATIPQGQAGSVTIQRQFRKSLVNFTVITDVASTNIGSNNLALITITVQWTFKNKTYSYPLETMVRQTT